ncbi:hypothetical protein OJAV_G00040080 [Oryzias javanicus]|uniref:EF-hand domain-containing protein n=1 Tax=Oryzias javanicus TaxID=123683 RepID=A0A3S2PD31_ORYJA|nr:hypothetical protein OJAV_G00040080 [Oryzias javanicus]
MAAAAAAVLRLSIPSPCMDKRPRSGMCLCGTGRPHHWPGRRGEGPTGNPILQANFSVALPASLRVLTDQRSLKEFITLLPETTRSTTRRQNSQIQEFKEAFNMIDQNRDGFIDKEDLHDMLASLGKNPSDEYLEGMMSEAPGPINFTMFLTMFGERLNGTDPEDVIRNAFACFDEEGSGVIHEDHLRELLTTMGDRFTDEEVDELFREAPIDKKGNFNYAEFTRILKHGAKDKDDE